MSSNATKLREDGNPYAAPTPAEDVVRTSPRLPAIAALLMGQLPFYAAMLADLALAPHSMVTRSDIAVGTMILLTFAAADNVTFNMRSLCSGPGALLPRAVAIACCQTAACFAVFWIAMATNYRFHLGTFMQSEGIAAFSAKMLVWIPWAFLPAMLIRSFGSFDRSDAKSGRFGNIWDWLFTVACVLLAVAALVPLARGYFVENRFFEELERLTRIRPQMIGPLILLTPLALIGQTWRIAIRGAVRSSRRKLIPVALSIGVQVLALAGLIVFAVVGGDPRSAISVAIGILVFFFLIPIVRESILRVAGYRAVNLYAERRKSRQDADTAALIEI